MSAPLRLYRPVSDAGSVRLKPDTTYEGAARRPAAVRSMRAFRHRAAAVRAAVVRRAVAADADAIAALVETHRHEAHLLARDREEIAAHAGRFQVADVDGRIVACADLAPLGRTVAEVRSLVVDPDVRSLGLGRRLLDELTSRAAAAGFATLCAFTHAPAYFVARGFSIVPHAWVPEKIQADCATCSRFRHCGQYAVVLPLAAVRAACVPLAALHG